VSLPWSLHCREMPYRPESYAEILRWLEDTVIQYVPHGKKAGTKSYDRYQKYSQATTVGQALEYGSLPMDLVNDLEKKLLKRVGGPIREKPLNVLEVPDNTTWSKTDLIIARWGYQLWRKENCTDEVKNGDSSMGKEQMVKQKQMFQKAKLAAQFGVKPENLAQGTRWAESPSMIAMRSRANVEAASILDAAAAEGRKVSDEDVLRVLRLWAVKKNCDRKNVMPDGTSWVHSETVGLLHCSGTKLLATLHTKQYPKVIMLLTQWMKDNRPEGQTRDFPFTSIIINSSFAAKRHRDHLNVGPSVVKAFGEFEGGRLRYWAEDNRCVSHELLREQDAVTIDVRDKAVVIDGNRAHGVEAYTGAERFSLVFFTVQGYERATTEIKEQVEQVGIPFPDEEAVKYARSLLSPPTGYSCCEEKPKLASDRSRTDAKKAISFLRGLQKPKKGMLLTRMMAMRAAASTAAAAAAPGVVPPAPVIGMQGDDEASKPKVKPLASRGLLARVLAKRMGGDKVQVAPSAPKLAPKLAPPRKPASKPQATGGLLARVQKRALAVAENAPQSPVSRKGTENTPPEQCTPTNKRARKDNTQSAGGPMTLSGKKLDLPSNPRKRDLTDHMAPVKSGIEEISAKEQSQPEADASAVKKVNSGQLAAKEQPIHERPGKVDQKDDGCLCFNDFAGVLSAAAGDPAEACEAVAERLSVIMKGSKDPENAIRAAMVLMEPTLVVPAGPLAAAIAEAFGMSCAPNLLGEALAAKALEGRQKQLTLHSVQPLTIVDVATVLNAAASGDHDEPQALINQLIKLLKNTQIGMEPFLLVRALQGKLAPCREVVRNAVAKAMAQIRC
jgi:hypothetical protein